jgi:uncharacterized protein (DUF1810 family)
MNTQYNLNRFIEAQDKMYEQVLNELSNGKKQTHWMWFIFPQIIGLGRSPIAKFYSIKNKEEAILYLENPILDERIKECSKLLLNIKNKTVSQIFAFPDDLKLQSAMTLFAYISNNNSIFHCVLDKYFDGNEDKKTLDLLEQNVK